MSNPNEDKSVDTRSYDRNLMGNVVRLPLVVGEAHGGTIETQKGPLMDFWGDEGVCSLGYNTPEVTQAMLGFMATGAPHQLPDVYPHPHRWQAAELLCSRSGMDRAFFANSGTEANEAAIKLARKYWWDKEGQPMKMVSQSNPIDPSGQLGQMVRSKTLANPPLRTVILTIEGNFHGRTGHSMAAGDYRVSPYHRHGFGEGPPDYGVLAVKSELGRTVNFSQVVTDGAEHEPHEPDWSSVAAIIMAPILGNNVVTTYPVPFWLELERIRKEHGVLLIFDDVQAGSGRSGHFATWQHPTCSVKPDIMTLAKGMAMGFPMSVMMATEEVTAAFTPGVHFNTFGGSPFMCFMAVKMIEWLDDNIHAVRSTGDYIRNWLGSEDWVKDVDGWGMLNAFTPDFQRNGYDGYDFIHEARAHGISLVTHRPYGPIRFTPRLNIGREELDIALEAVHNTHQALCRARLAKG